MEYACTYLQGHNINVPKQSFKVAVHNSLSDIYIYISIYRHEMMYEPFHLSLRWGN